MKVLIETSARHIHLCKEHLEILFGKDANLTVKKELSQPGQFCSCQKVSIVGPRNTIDNVSILGPVRSYTQVEISLTDARKLGIEPKVRISGDIDDTPGCKVIGPYGELELNHGVIIAKRHIHMTPSDSEKLSLTDRQSVSVKVDSNDRSLIFNDVIIRINKKFATVMHIDTDEANAASIKCTGFGEIIL